MGSSLPAEAPSTRPDQVQRGAMLFMDPRLSSGGQRSCATCHPGGGSDGKVYKREVEVTPGDPSGRRTLPLRGLWQKPPYLWDGSLETVREAVERMLAVELGGPAPPPYDVDALEAYVLSIPVFDNGRIEPSGSPVEPATLSSQRGAELFQTKKCASCHPPPSFGSTKRRNVGTGGKWRVPSLRDVSNQPRLGHDGRWPNLESAVREIVANRGVKLTAQELQQLLSYLNLL
jgi:cytochrome c peroxidase